MDTRTLIQKELSGSLTPSEKIQLISWLEETQENQDEFLNIKLLLQHKSESTKDLNPEPLLAIKTRINIINQERNSRKTSMRILFATPFIIGMMLLLTLLPKKNPQAAQPLTFDQTPFSQVIAELKSKRSIEILASSLASPCLFTGSLSRAGTEEEIIQTLSIALQLTLEKTAPHKYKLIQANCEQANNQSRREKL